MPFACKAFRTGAHARTLYPSSKLVVADSPGAEMAPDWHGADLRKQSSIRRFYNVQEARI